MYKLNDKVINSTSEKIKQSLINELKESCKFNVDNEIKKMRRCLVRIIKKKNYVLEDRSFFWINGLYAYGLFALVKYNDDDIAKKVLIRFYNKFLIKKKFHKRFFEIPDQMIHAYIILELYFHYGQKSYDVLVGDAKQYLINESLGNPDGLILYRGVNSDFYLDTIGMMTEFCTKCYLFLGEEEVLHLAERQIDYVLKNGMETGSCLPYHAINIKTRQKFGSNNWGRGICWFLIGITEVMESSNNHEYLSSYTAIIEILFSKQDEHGYLMEDLLDNSHIDTSVTAMGGYCLCVGIKNGWIDEKYQLKLFQCVNALLDSTDEKGNVNDCSGECHGAGSYAYDYGNYFAQGYTLRLLLEMRKLFP